MPTTEQIEVILAKKLQKHNNSVLKTDIKSLAKKLVGYSPFDLDKLIDFVFDHKDEQLENESYFCKDLNGCYQACKSTAEGAIKLSYNDICQHKYKYSVITCSDLISAMHSVKPSNKQEDEQEHIDFEKEMKKNFKWKRKHTKTGLCS